MSRVRIIGGEHRSRLLPVAEVKGLRPTPDRVRETVFNWLGQELDGLRCLDLFAGSGALGFEAASRGALAVDMVEMHPQAARVLEQNAQLLRVPVRIVRGDAVKFAAAQADAIASGRAPAYDVVFLDPPYHQGWLDKVAPLLNRLLSSDGWLYVEAEQALTGLAGWQTLKSGKAGQVHYHLMQCPLPKSEDESDA